MVDFNYLNVRGGGPLPPLPFFEAEEATACQLLQFGSHLGLQVVNLHWGMCARSHPTSLHTVPSQVDLQTVTFFFFSPFFLPTEEKGVGSSSSLPSLVGGIVTSSVLDLASGVTCEYPTESAADKSFRDLSSSRSRSQRNLTISMASLSLRHDALPL
jgi:hypothetical protein